MTCRTLLLATLLATPLLGCAAKPTVAPGSDRDAHGCIPSAGYTWCAYTGQCERPWELATAKGFAPTPEAFAAYCGQPTR